MKLREIQKFVTGRQTQDGAGVRLTRMISHQDVVDFDPFLMLDSFDSTDPDDYIRGFPWHPHRGIETVTYLISGDIEHGDSLGNRGNILDGCCQWMTAGSGIIHQEMPKPSPKMLGVQLWINLPRSKKMTAPAYRDIREIPETTEPDSTVRVLSGHYKDTTGATQGEYVHTVYLDVDIKPGGTFNMSSDPENTLFVFIILGGGRFGSSSQLIPAKSAVLFGSGDHLSASAGEFGMRMLVLSGKPLHEPIAWGGPIVMNTQEELDQAFRDLEDNTFIKG